MLIKIYFIYLTLGFLILINIIYFKEATFFSDTVKMIKDEREALERSCAHHYLYNIYYSLVGEKRLKARLQEQVINSFLIKTFQNYNHYTPEVNEMSRIGKVEIPPQLHPFEEEVGYILLFYYLYIKRYFTKFYIFYFRFLSTLTIIILLVMMMNEMRS